MSDKDKSKGKDEEKGKRKRRTSTRSSIDQSCKKIRLCAEQVLNSHVIAMVAVPHTPDTPWCFNNTSGVTPKQARQADKKGKGWFRAISPPFFHGTRASANPRRNPCDTPFPPLLCPQRPC